MASQAGSSKTTRIQRPAAAQKKTNAPPPVTSPDTAPGPSPAAESAAPAPGAVAPLVPSGTPFPFAILPSAPAEYRIQVPGNPERLNLNFHVAGSSAVDAYLRYGSSPGKAASNLVEHAAPGSTSVDILPQSSPPLRDGTYYLRLESAAPAGGYFVATAVATAVQTSVNTPQTPSIFSSLSASPPWLIAALWVGAMACLGLLFLKGIRTANRQTKELKDALGGLNPVSDSLREIKQSIKDLTGALADRLHWAELPAAPHPDEPSANSMAARIRQLLENEPMLITARLVRDVAGRAGGEVETELSRNFAGYLAALDRAERLLADASVVPDDEWSALHRAIGALQARHNPVFFLDVIDEAGRQRMPQKAQLLATLGIEEISPPTGLEIVDLTSYQIEHTIGMGRRSILDKVLSSGYRSRETGEVYRKPAIAVRLESGYTTAV
ncbi:MAG: hypothetical protein ABSG65_01825 [Bryobacteraceae bacterium]